MTDQPQTPLATAAGPVNFFHLQVSKLMGESRREMNGFASRRRLVAGVSKFGEFCCFWWWMGQRRQLVRRPIYFFLMLRLGEVCCPFALSVPFAAFSSPIFAVGGELPLVVVVWEAA